MYPRRNIPGEFVEDSRGTHENERLLNPRARNDNGYAFAHAAERTGARWSIGLVLPDRVASLTLHAGPNFSDYLRTRHAIMTGTRNRVLGRVDTIWDGEIPQKSEVDDWSAFKRAVVRLACEPVERGLCKHPDDYHGWYGPDLWAIEAHYTRPRTSSSRTRWPESTTTNPQPPPFAPDKCLSELIAEIREAIEDALPAANKRAAKSRRERRRQRITNRLGRVCRSPAARRARKRAARTTLPEFQGRRAAYNQAVLNGWRRDYARSKRQFHADPTTVFPAGTVRYRQLGARCSPAPPYQPPGLRTRPPP